MRLVLLALWLPGVAIAQDADNDLDGWTPNQGDCDDDDPTISPGAVEICDGLDNDCNGVVDDGIGAIPWYPDADADGFGDTGPLSFGCSQLPGTASNDLDCDDTDPLVHPGAIDFTVNGIDEDCDGLDAGLPLNIDADNDGFQSPFDCDDNDPNTFPGAPEQCDNRDNDCDGTFDEGLPTTPFHFDNDGDGYGGIDTVYLCMQPPNTTLTLEDCNDLDPSINPAAQEVPGNGIDEDCDGLDGPPPPTGDPPAPPAPDPGIPPWAIDNDGDGWFAAEDCNDNDPTRFPGAIELCADPVDRNCDGRPPLPCEDVRFQGCRTAPGGLLAGLLARR